MSFINSFQDDFGTTSPVESAAYNRGYNDGYNEAMVIGHQRETAALMRSNEFRNDYEQLKIKYDKLVKCIELLNNFVVNDGKGWE